MNYKRILALTLVIIMIFATNVYAFNDLPESPEATKIKELQKRGIIEGYVNGELFKGENKLTNAEGVQLIVKGTELSLAAFLFIKAPLASDSFNNVPEDAWYTDSFIIAAVNGVELPRDIDPDAEMTREEFAHHLLSAMLIKGDYPFTKKLFVIEDDADINPDYKHSIQLLLNAQITQLDKDNNFLPKQAITRMEAGVMLYDAIAFMKAHPYQMPDPNLPVDEPVAEDPVTMSSTNVNEDIQKVTLSWGEQPNAGYQLMNTRIEFQADQKAVIFYKLQYPEEGKMYAQVITTPEAVTYIPTGYTVTIQQD